MIIKKGDDHLPGGGELERVHHTQDLVKVPASGQVGQGGGEGGGAVGARL